MQNIDNKTTNSNPTRRSFLKGTVAGISTLSMTTPNWVLANPGEPRIIKIGLIGCGGRGNGAVRDAIRAYEGIRLVAMADVFDEHIQAQRAQLKAELPEYIQVDDDHCFAGLDGYKRLLETDVDVVLIACASLFHPRYSHAAIEAGKHVFVEKPHGIDPAGARLMSLACEFAKLKNLCLVSGLMNRYVPEYRKP